MFKKTLIAAAVATVASTAAMAGDSSVSGQVKYTLADTDGAATDWAASFDNSITFKSTEDLGNGLTAFAQITIDTDVDTDTTATADTAVASTGAIEKDAKLGVKGAFGTIVAGRMEYLIQGAFSSKMDDGGGNGNLESNLTDLGRANAVAYVSPTVNGVHVAMAGNNDGTATGMFNNKEILVAYANGPLNVMASKVDVKDNSDMTSLYASYAIGDAKVSAMTVDRDYDAGQGTDARDSMYRLDYTMGSNVVTVGTRDAEATADDMDIVKLTHKLSKRTAVWVGHRNKGTGYAGDVTHFGMIHKF